MDFGCHLSLLCKERVACQAYSSFRCYTNWPATAANVHHQELVFTDIFVCGAVNMYSVGIYLYTEQESKDHTRHRNTHHMISHVRTPLTFCVVYLSSWFCFTKTMTYSWPSDGETLKCDLSFPASLNLARGFWKSEGEILEATRGGESKYM